jgi:hypothetical protein
MKTKSLLVLSLVGAAAVVGVGAIGVSGIAINSNVEATSSKTMIFNSTTNKPTYPSDGTAISSHQTSYTATTLSSGSFVTGTSGLAVTISSDKTSTSGKYSTSSAYWLVVRPIYDESSTYNCNFSIAVGISAVIENAYINFQATNGITTADSSVSWTFSDQNGTSHMETITNGTAFSSLGYKVQGASSVFAFTASKTGDFSFDIETISFSWSC